MKTVERGAALLDERLPGWDAEIDVENLNMSNACDCVFGQLFGSYDKGLRVLVMDQGTSKTFGFFVWPTSRWSSLSFAWRNLIRERRAARAES